MDRRGDIRTALIYDSALISRIHETYHDFLRSFSRTGDVGSVGHRLLSVFVFYFTSRIIHKSGLTPGEELVPRSACKSPVSSRQRVRLLLSSLAIPFLKELVDTSGNRTRYSQLILRVVSDGYFFFSPAARTTSLIEHWLFPKDCQGDSPSPHVKLSGYIFKLAGLAVAVKCIEDLHRIVARKNTVHEMPIDAHPLPAHDGKDVMKPTCGNCPICMSEIERPTASICGHIFCWDCSMSWVVPDGKPCPICRTVSHPQDLLPLVNYAPSKTEWRPFWTKPFIIQS